MNNENEIESKEKELELLWEWFVECSWESLREAEKVDFGIVDSLVKNGGWGEEEGGAADERRGDVICDWGRWLCCVAACGTTSLAFLHKPTVKMYQIKTKPFNCNKIKKNQESVIKIVNNFFLKALVLQGLTI